VRFVVEPIAAPRLAVMRETTFVERAAARPAGSHGR
jgi:hypothetical protein